MIFLMMKNRILGTSLVFAGVLTLSVLAKADFGSSVFAQTVTPKMHLEEGIAALKAGNTQGALMHVNAAENGLTSSSTDQSAKMHIDEGIAALKAGNTQGALMHLGAADKVLGGSGSG